MKEDKETNEFPTKAELIEMLNKDIEVMKKHFPLSHRFKIRGGDNFLQISMGSRYGNGEMVDGEIVDGSLYEFREEQEYPLNRTPVWWMHNDGRNLSVSFGEDNGGLIVGDSIPEDGRGVEFNECVKCWCTVDGKLKSKEWKERFGDGE